ncbi:PDDEXK family nuclease [Methylosarcina fibrata]|uniref:hypothetical protein n=1 Tax=Methylosarcina fibrata TaxID=105972 RepID=UPI0003726DDF|nr:hypothetical protein [Methylosarcina fibrata]
MLFKVSENEKSLSAVKSDWRPKELQLEALLVSPADDASAQILSEAVFGEPLLLISNQVRTRTQKRADILALDRGGNAVIIELKRDFGQLGVETQALQYLSDFSIYKGEAFLSRFAPTASQRGDIQSFLGNEPRVEDVNKNPRIILVARAFDETVFSLGEWLSSKGVSFRCIAYTPVAVGSEKFVSFSVAFDRSVAALFALKFSAAAREPGFFWHNIARADESWWRFLVNAGQIPACFDDSPGDQGEKILNRYIGGDIVVAYAKGYGAVGWGEVLPGNTYRLLEIGSTGDFLKGCCLHRLSVRWRAVAEKLNDALPAEYIRNEFGIYHPISTSVSMSSESGKRLIAVLSERFGALQ